MGEHGGGPISEPAPAKLNPFLRVLGRRRDGYHDVETLVLPITLADAVRASPAEDLSLVVTGERARDVPSGEENLVLRAARALREECETDRGAALLLAKRVPVAAGLGGGSADAAATLRALRDLWGCDLEYVALLDVAASVGSDVPALVVGGPVIASGRGERVERVELPRTWWAVVPASGVSTAEAYFWWDEEAAESGPDPGPLHEVLRAGDLDAAAGYLFNDLEGPVSARHPGVGLAREALHEAGAIGTVMCGSGPSVAGLARDGTHAQEIASGAGGVAVASLPGGRSSTH
jgi:4-diphosphocytidyl-2-C-methyl-D-erythritol kinase